MSERDNVWTLTGLSFSSAALSIGVLKLVGHPDIASWWVVLGCGVTSLFCMLRVVLRRNP